MKTQFKSWVGIDVCKDKLDVYIHPDGQRYCMKQTDKEIIKLGQKIKDMDAHVILEASGGYESIVAGLLTDMEISVTVVNPRQVRDFARATGTLAKTDMIDAQMLALFGEAVKPEVRPLPDSCTQRLRAMVRRRQQIVDMLIMEENRLGQSSGTVKDTISKHIAWLTQCLKDLDKEIKNLISSSPVWREKDELLRSVPGVGSILSAALLAQLPELGHLNHKQVASLVGVAPLNRDSGTMRGRRTVWGGRGHLRAILYMAVISAIRCNPAIRAFYNRLKLAGKCSKVAITACMRKLLIILNAIVKRNVLWNPEVYLQTS